MYGVDLLLLLIIYSHGGGDRGRQSEHNSSCLVRNPSVTSQVVCENEALFPNASRSVRRPCWFSHILNTISVPQSGNAGNNILPGYNHTSSKNLDGRFDAMFEKDDVQ
ncbi:hypothetical protein F4813DRAFT_376760 [Daldinia decipiens]|uniref:uncharacterized protein n=1 Tax=Daldinia decipiens TaxID=326647 RepID=UPI0020C2450F|nr:uncharacterized protein F4813DRAFT_376760 [Daldinia decipiens]KAI1652864.1 hypothetical protein F4813DRAFT_376760 [Daldinia decipiens]